MYSRRPSSALAAAASVDWAGAAAGAVPLVASGAAGAGAGAGTAWLSAVLSTAVDILMAEDTKGRLVLDS